MPSLPNAPQENPTELTQVVSAFLKQLKIKIDSKPENNEVIRQEIAKLPKEQLEELDRQVRSNANVPEIFKEGSEMHALLVKEIATVQEKTKSSLDTLKDTLSERSVQIGVVAGVGTVLGSIMLYKAWKSIRGGTQKALDTTKEKVGSATRFLLLTGAAIAAGIAGSFAAVKAYRYFENYAAKKMQEAILAGQAKLDEMQKHYRDVTDQLKQSTAEERAVLEKQQADLLKKIEAMQTTLVMQLQKRKEAEEKAKKPTASEQAPIPGVKTESPAVPEKAPELREVKLAAVAKGLNMLFKNDKIQTVIGQLREKPMREIFAQYDSAQKNVVTAFEDWYAPPEESFGNDREEYKIAAQQLVELCARNQSLIEKVNAKNTTPLDVASMPLGIFLEKIGGGIAMAHNTLEQVKQHKDDLSKWNAQQTFLDEVKKGNVSIGGKLGETLSEDLRSKMPEKLQSVTLEEILEYLKTHALDAQFTARYFLQAAIPEDDKIGQSLKLICEEGLKPEAIAPFFHEVLPNHEWNHENIHKNYEVIRDFIMEMHVADVVRLYSYDRMAHSDKEVEVAGGLAMLQAEILRFVRVKDSTLGGILKPDAYNIAGSLVYNALTQPEELQQMLEKMDVPPGMQEQAAAMLSTVATSMGEGALLGALGIAREQASGILGMWQKNKLIGTGIGVIGGSVILRGATNTALSPLRDPARLALWKYRRSDPEEVIHTLKATSKWYNGVTGLTRATYAKYKNDAMGHHARGRAATALEEMLKDMSEGLSGDPFKEIYAELKLCIANGASPEDFLKLEQSLDAFAPPATAKKITREAFEKLRDRLKNFAVGVELQDAREALMLHASPVRERLGVNGSNQPNKLRAGYARLLEDTELKDILAKSQMSVGDAEAVMKLVSLEGEIAIDADDLIMITRSKKAKELLAGAIATMDKVEVERVLKAASNARRIPAALNALGAGADAFGIYMGAADWMDNNRRIAETKNPALKELYANARPLYATEIGTSTVGIAFGTYGFVSTWSAGGSLLTAIAAPVGTVMLPIGLAVAGAGYTYRSLEETSEHWLKTGKDWVKNDNADIIKRLHESPPGSTTLGQKIVRTFNDAENVEDANENMRSGLYRAYLQKNSVLPQRINETKEEHKNRYQVFVSDQVRYISGITRGENYLVNPEEFENARMYAELLMEQRDLAKAGQSRLIEVVDEYGRINEIPLGKMIGEQSIDNLVRNLKHVRKKQGQNEFVELALFANNVGRGKSSPAVELAVRNIMLEKMKHFINAFESRLREQNFSGIDDVQERALVRAYVRTVLLDAVDAVTGMIIGASTHPETLSNPAMKQKYDDTLDVCMGMLREKPVGLLGLAKQSNVEVKPEDASDASLLFLVPGVAKAQAKAERSV